MRRHHTEQTPEFDDKITITKLTENKLKIMYIEKSGPDTIIDVSYMGYYQFMAYMNRILYMLIIDEDPFLSIQFMVPGYPSTLIMIPNLKERVMLLLELLWSTCVTWPSARSE